VNLTDDELRDLIARERERFYGQNDPALETVITRWPQTLPHYNLELERVLTTLPAPPRQITLVGNYLGRIGLAKLLERAAYVSDQLTETI
jgi:protoporphyrinogen oxidase